MELIQLEHTQGHDKFWRLAHDNDVGVLTWGKRGTTGQTKILRTRAAVQQTRDRYWAKRDKGYVETASFYATGYPDNAARSLAAATATVTGAFATKGTSTLLIFAPEYRAESAARPWLSALGLLTHGITDRGAYAAVVHTDGFLHLRIGLTVRAERFNGPAPDVTTLRTFAELADGTVEHRGDVNGTGLSTLLDAAQSLVAS